MIRLISQIDNQVITKINLQGSKSSMMINAIFLFIILSLMNCATMFSTSEYNYSIKSNVNADVTVISSGQPMSNLKTPFSLYVKMNKATILRFNAEGYEEKFYVLERDFNFWFWWNFFIGGPLGLIVDYNTGAMYKPKYEITDISVELVPIDGKIKK